MSPDLRPGGAAPMTGAAGTDDHENLVTPEPIEQVEELRPGMGGRWLVTTQGSTHVWDLDQMTYERRPGSRSLSGAFAYDGEPHRITQVGRWPKAGETSLVYYDDPTRPYDTEQWRQSSRIVSIARLADIEEQP